MKTITTDDVRTLLPQVPHIEHDIPDAESIRGMLVFFGISRREQLERFVKAKEVFDFLADVYKRELHRDAETPLDPTAVAVWGTILFIRGFGPSIQQEVIRKIQESDEYRQKHPNSGGGLIPAGQSQYLDNSTSPPTYELPPS